MILKEGELIKDRYRLLSFRGRGSFGEVWLARDEFLDMEVALKIYISLDRKGIDEFRSEYKVTFALNHPNLLHISYFDFLDQRPYLVMPYCPTSSESLIGNISEEDAWRFIRDVSSGLAYLHSKKIIHRDIKPDNILRNEQGDFLISDFGITVKMRSTLRRASTRNINDSKDTAGSLAYMGPELFSSNPTPVMATDIWALGATLYEMLEGELPFFGQGGVLLLNGAESPDIPGNWSQSLKATVSACLSRDTWERPKAEEISHFSNDYIKGSVSRLPWEDSWELRKMEEDRKRRAAEERKNQLEKQRLEEKRQRRLEAEKAEAERLKKIAEEKAAEEERERLEAERKRQEELARQREEAERIREEKERLKELRRKEKENASGTSSKSKFLKPLVYALIGIAATIVGFVLYPTLADKAKAVDPPSKPVTESVPLKADTPDSQNKPEETTVTHTEESVSQVASVIPISEISLNKTQLSMTVGEQASLKASILPTDATDKSLTWTSSNPRVATVSSGSISAKSVGRTVVSVRSKDGRKTASCTITVEAKSVDEGIVETDPLDEAISKRDWSTVERYAKQGNLKAKKAVSSHYLSIARSNLNGDESKQIVSHNYAVKLYDLGYKDEAKEIVQSLNNMGFYDFNEKGISKPNW